MGLRLAAHGGELSTGLKDYVKRRMHFHLGRFAGPRGGIGKCCDIRLDAGLGRAVIVRERRDNLHTAVALAVERVQRAVQRQLNLARPSARRPVAARTEFSGWMRIPSPGDHDSEVPPATVPMAGKLAHGGDRDKKPDAHNRARTMPIGTGGVGGGSRRIAQPGRRPVQVSPVWPNRPREVTSRHMVSTLVVIVRERLGLEGGLYQEPAEIVQAAGNLTVLRRESAPSTRPQMPIRPGLTRRSILPRSL